MSSYDFSAIESKWQDYWVQNKTFRTPENVDTSKPKYYVLDMFPYPSGVGLHVGHPLGYIATDIIARYKRMQGFNVLHPMGFDAFGLPAEQYAVEHGVHPRITTDKSIENMLGQLKRLGLSYDWDRVLATTDEGYYRWTQWIFLKMYKSYYDPTTDGARPIADLVADLEVESQHIDPEGTITAAATEDSVAWNTLPQRDRDQLLAKIRLAFLEEVPVNWCPGLGTVLANEEVTNEGRSERGNYPVFRRPLKQWMLRITKYADRLEGGLGSVDWPEPIKLMQRNWIGRSEGASAVFRVNGLDEGIEVFTTRPDTLFGATYMVLAPEHSLVDIITTPDNQDAVKAYRDQAERQSDVDRMVESRQKTGVFTGSFAINPVNGKAIPIWIADYVLMGYGTGAIMAVPAHDQRDFEFAKQFDLPVVAVVLPDDTWLESHGVSKQAYLADASIASEAFVGSTLAVNSQSEGIELDGLDTPTAKKTITKWLENQGLGRKTIQYKLRDWLFSRQRYWGEPFPILHASDGAILPVPEEELPVVLPPMEDFRPTASDDPDAPPRPPLGRASREWSRTEIDGVEYTRELNTMPNWAGSCWYYLRFIDPANTDQLIDPEHESYWMGSSGVDLYVGGVEHAVLHLLYARFWHKVLHDLGYVSTAEPFGKLVNQGYIQAYAYRDERGIIVPADEVVDQDGRPAIEVQDQKNREFSFQGERVVQEYGKMGKSLKNAVNPDEITGQFGCDTLRLYEMYLGPLEQSKPWNTRDIVGVNRFLKRVWRVLIDDSGTPKLTDETADEELLRALHKTIQRVTDDLERMSFNTAIAALIEFTAVLTKSQGVPTDVAKTMVLLLAPMAPHIAEELWNRLGNTESLAYQQWPVADEELLRESLVTIGVQVNGKVRGSISFEANASKDDVLALAREEPNVRKYLDAGTLRKEIYVPGKIVNLVVN
ncbi:MAG: leucine--tRNA ligase [Rhodothermales bacterium]|nr:leucine--tRNA ligase [Rhodothermales bacterium]